MKKNKLIRQTWAKLLAAAIAAISAIAIVICAFFTIMFGMVEEFARPAEELRDGVNRQLLKGYCAELYRCSGLSSKWNTNEEETPVWDSLDGGNIRYCVLSAGGRVLYSNNLTVDENHCLESYEVTPGYEVSGAGRDGFLNLFFRERTNYVEPICYVDVSEIVYNESDGLFYCRGTDYHYYLIREFGLEHQGQTEGYFTLEEQTHGTSRYKDEAGKALDAANVKALEKGEKYMTIQDGASVDIAIESVGKISENLVVSTAWSNFESEDGCAWLNYQPESAETGYLVCMDVADSLKEGAVLKNGMKDYFPEAEQLSSFLISFRHTSGWYLALSVILFLASFAFLMQVAGRRPEDDEIHICFVDKIPFGILSIVAAGLAAGCVLLGILMVDLFWDGSFSFSLAFAGGILAMGVCAAVALAYFMSIAVRVKAKKFWHYTLLHYLWTPFRWAKQMLVAKTPLLFKAIAVFAVVTIVEAIGVASCLYDGDAMAVGFFFFKLVEFGLLLWLVYQLYRIREGGRRIAAGDYSHPIDTSRMLGELRKHAENINNVGNGISQAVEARMKSERFKTELITNVSHDIKTPLTSIINYVDLMKKEQIENPTVMEYIEILDHQSARLKKLIEDLMEASKASTGNLPVHLEVCDATVMLTQVVGEFEDRAKANNLELVVTSQEPPADIMADGRHLWRIIDNLMSNICKYAMPGTRVYIDLEKFHGMVIMTFRNISKSRLNISSEELMERFVRGDSSRNTEGNGLGLSIAQSLTDLMEGNLAVQIDGDLFKVILSFEECKNKS